MADREITFSAEQMRGIGKVAVTQQALRVTVNEQAVRLDQETDVIVIPIELWSDVNAAVVLLAGK